MFIPKLSCRADPAPSPSARSATRHAGHPRIFSLAPGNRTLCLKTELTSLNVEVGAFVQSEGALYIPFGSILDRLEDLPERVEQMPQKLLDQTSDQPSGLPVNQGEQQAVQMTDPSSDESFDLLGEPLVDQSDERVDQPTGKSIDEPEQPIDLSVHIPWTEWGGNSTWLGTSGLSTRNECFIFGQRVVMSGLDSDSKSAGVVFDFDPIRMSHYALSDESEAEIGLFDPETDMILDNRFDENDTLRKMFFEGECKANAMPTMRADRLRTASEFDPVMISDEHGMCLSGFVFFL